MQAFRWDLCWSGGTATLARLNVAHRTHDNASQTSKPCNAASALVAPSEPHAADKDHLIYFSSTFSIFPTFFSTSPAMCSAWPSALKSGLFVTWPTVAFTLTFTS